MLPLGKIDHSGLQSRNVNENSLQGGNVQMGSLQRANIQDHALQSGFGSPGKKFEIC